MFYQSQSSSKSKDHNETPHNKTYLLFQKHMSNIIAFIRSQSDPVASQREELPGKISISMATTRSIATKKCSIIHGLFLFYLDNFVALSVLYLNSTSLSLSFFLIIKVIARSLA